MKVVKCRWKIRRINENKRGKWLCIKILKPVLCHTGSEGEPYRLDLLFPLWATRTELSWLGVGVSSARQLITFELAFWNIFRQN